MSFKQLTEDNWFHEDPTIRAFVKINPKPGSVAFQPYTKEDWVRRILAPKLLEIVPEDVKNLVEVARGAMLYGVFFYPLFTLGSEQLYRILETVIIRKSNELGFQVMKSKKGKSIKNSQFMQRVKYLKKLGVIDEKKEIGLEAAWNIRNTISHPKRQNIDMPGSAIGNLDRTINLINLLFSNTNQSLMS